MERKKQIGLKGFRLVLAQRVEFNFLICRQVERIVDTIMSFIGNSDLIGFNDFWRMLERKFFSRLPTEYGLTQRRLLNSLRKKYVVHAMQTNRAERVKEFYDSVVSELCNDPDWRPWFGIIRFAAVVFLILIVLSLFRHHSYAVYEGTRNRSAV